MLRVIENIAEDISLPTQSITFGLVAVALPTKVKVFCPGCQSLQIVFEMW